jgi:putative membrane protein
VRRFLINWLVIVVAVVLANQLLPNQIDYHQNFTDLAVFALVLGVLNTIVRPVVKLLTCPLTLLTLGLFSLVINAAMFWLAASLTGDVAVASFFSAFVAALIVSVVNLVAGSVLS